MRPQANKQAAETALIGIDWGTTHLRAYRIGLAGQVLDRRESTSGIASVRDGNFDAALQSLVRDWQTGASNLTPILMCGMIGSRQGWREVPYRSCPARPHDFAEALDFFDTSCGPASIVAGLEATDERKRHDVMRGEETQIFGVAPPTGEKLIVTPGTHSKWAVVRDGTIESFRTYMTGEVYAVLRQHSILGRLMREDGSSKEDEASFLEGVHEALEEPDLLHSLFSVRTRGLFEQSFEQRPAGALASYLSGVLIGSEVSGALWHHRAGSIVVIASAALGRLYRAALSFVGFTDIQSVDANEAVTQGLWRLWQLRGAKRQH